MKTSRIVVDGMNAYYARSADELRRLLEAVEQRRIKPGLDTTQLRGVVAQWARSGQPPRSK